MRKLLSEVTTDLNALVIFAKVAESASFSEAARRLEMPVSTVSRRIAVLEGELGVRLLERSTRLLRLTDIGAELLAHAQQSVEISDVIQHVIRDRATRVSGLLRISVPYGCNSLVAPLLASFGAKYPDVRIYTFVTERHVDLVAEGFDLALRINPQKDPSLVSQILIAYRDRLVASPEYLVRTRPPVKPRDLIEHRLLAFSRGESDITWGLSHANGREHDTVRFRPHLAMNDFSGLSSALLEGAGIGNLPSIASADLLNQGRLVEVMPEWQLSTFELAIVHLANRYVSRPVRLFKEFALRLASDVLRTMPR